MFPFSVTNVPPFSSPFRRGEGGDESGGVLSGVGYSETTGTWIVKPIGTGPKSRTTVRLF